MRSSFALISAVTATLSSAASIPQTQTPLRNILDNTDKSEKYTYPTDFTREIVPVSFQSIPKTGIERKRDWRWS
jgi:hypothetical protein